MISNKQLRARIDTRKVDLLYAYYWFASAWMQNYFIRNNKGSTVPLITLSELKDAPISYPEDITEQKKIAMAIEAISVLILSLWPKHSTTTGLHSLISRTQRASPIVPPAARWSGMTNSSGRFRKGGILQLFSAYIWSIFDKIHS